MTEIAAPNVATLGDRSSDSILDDSSDSDFFDSNGSYSTESDEHVDELVVEET